MLTVEQSRRLIELSKIDNYIYFPPGKRTKDGHILYKGHPFNMHFYQDCIDGININADISIIPNEKMISIYIKDEKVFECCYDDFESLNQAKEKALIFVLENVKWKSI